MSLVVLLDAGPLGLASNPRQAPENDAINLWLENLLTSGIVVGLPEIADYEVRRELLRAKKVNGLARLNALKATLLYFPITTEAMLVAAELWAQARQRGRPAAGSASLDADMILAAQAHAAARGGDDVVVATTNVRHLDLFVDARVWRDID